MKKEDIKQEIRRMCLEKNAVILAHYYTEGEVQDIADFVIANGLNEDVAAVPESSLYLLDKKMIGKLQRQNDNGVIQAKHIGTATVVASLFNNLHDNCNIIVKEAPSSLKFNKKRLNMGIGEEFDLKAIIPDNSASHITMHSSNPRVADVDENGRIKAVGLGTAEIIAQTFNGLSAKCTVTVKEAPTDITLNTSDLTIKAGETFKLSAKLPKGTASNELIFRSSDPSVCKIDKSTGVITAKSPGVSRVSVTTYNGESESIEVDVV